MIAFDFETFLISPGFLAPPPVCLSHAGDVRGTQILHAKFNKKACETFLREMLKGECVGANTAFDLGVAAAEWPELLPLIFDALEDGRVHDIQIAQKLIDIALGQLNGYSSANGYFVRYQYSLVDLEKRHLGQDRSASKGEDAWRMRYSELHNTPVEKWPAEAIDYPIADAVGTLKVFEKQLEGWSHLLEDEPAQSRASFALHLMSCWGLRTDPQGVEAFKRKTEARFNDLTKELLEAGLIRPNGSRDTKAAKIRIANAYENMGQAFPLTETGKEKKWLGELPEPITYAALDEEACENSGDELLIKYAERTSLQTIVSSHIPALEKGFDTPIQPRFNVLVESGRTSCSMGKGSSTHGYQVQNVRRQPGLRECFVAREGTLFADADFSGLELCTMAQACIDLVGFSRMGDALNAGVDVHLDLGAQLVGMSYEEARARKHEKAIKEARQLAKVANFGFPGGLGPSGFKAFARGYGMIVTEDDAKHLKNVWLSRWSEFDAYFKHVRDLCEACGVAQVMQLRSNRVRGLVPYTAACNTYFQGLGADGAKAALWEVSKRCYVNPTSMLFGSRPVNFVHDQIIAEVPAEVAAQAAEELGRVMVQACNFFLPDVPVKCEPCLSKRWTKDATAIYVDGELFPWDVARDAKMEAYYADGKRVEW